MNKGMKARAGIATEDRHVYLRRAKACSAELVVAR
jgi:hypothetical protein